MYVNKFKSSIRQEAEAAKGLSKGPGPLTDLPDARPLWGYEPPLANIPHPPYTDAVKEEVVRLLQAGERVSQIAALLRVPTSLVYRLRKQFIDVSQPEKDTYLVMDRRCLYDKAIKQEAIRQIQLGVSVRKLAQTMGISSVTLHKWKKAAQLERPSAEEPKPPIDLVDQLRARLIEAEEERDALKKALTILLRS